MSLKPSNTLAFRSAHSLLSSADNRNPRILKSFNGDIFEDVEDWLQRYEQVTAFNQWDDAAYLRNVYFSLDDGARTWFENRENQLSSWTPVPFLSAAMDTPCLSPHLYTKNNGLQRGHSSAVLDFCQPSFFAEPKATMQFLDVGCGTGNFTRDCLLPRCFPCRRIVATDCSQEMIHYAKQHFPHEKVEHHVLDIGSDVSDFIHDFGQFDRVYSFYCLQWLKDQGAALKNISRLLTTDGECLLVIPATQQPAAVWSLLASMDRWAKYSETLLGFIPDNHYMTDKREQIRCMSSLLNEAGLTPNVFTLPRLAAFDGLTEDELVGAHMSLLPINHLVPESERAELLADVTALVRRIHGPETDPSIFRIYIIIASKRKT
ncbi:juvenile hormone acid O-methyltransferase-like [Amblyomma americanum]